MKKLALVAALLIAFHADAAGPTKDEAKAALEKASKYMHGIACQGGYGWVSSVDGKVRNGEGACGPGTVWVQPPGTPAVGEAFLDAHEATGDEVHLNAAKDVGKALVRGQLRSGGWHYHIDFDPPLRRNQVYRIDGNYDPATLPKTPAPGGWDVWKQRRNKNDMTMIDDDVTPASLRFLMRLDRALKFGDKAVHDAVLYALTSTANAQYPIGAWSHNYDQFPTEPPSVEHYPILKATYPERWSRAWTKDFAGCYMLNDRITQNMIATMLLAHSIYGDKKYLDSALRGGDFLLKAQMPNPQPGWCQEYNRQMQPVWDRKFEPPAITGFESQDAMETLLLLYRETGEKRFLEPLPAALAYFKKCVLPNGKVARFYELQTNKPLYFTKTYQLTYNPEDSPTHYGFQFPSRLDKIEAEYNRLLKDRAARPAVDATELAAAARKAIETQNKEGVWVEPGTVRDHAGRKLTPAEGVVHSQTFIDNMTALTRFVQDPRR